MSASVFLRRLGLPLSQQLGKRGFAGHAVAVPKADTSLDHVFGSTQLTHDFSLYSTGQTFLMNAMVVGLMAVPIVLMVQEDSQIRELESRIATAKAAKEAS